MSPSPFGLSGLSFLFRLVLPPSSDGCAGHSGFSFLFWLVSPPSSGGCVVLFLPLMRSTMSLRFWTRYWFPLLHWSGLGALGRVRPLTWPQNVVIGSGAGSERFVSVKGDSLLASSAVWHGSSINGRHVDLPAPVTVPDTWQELSQDSPLASSGGFRTWARGFLLQYLGPSNLSCATGATAATLTYWLW